MSAVRQSAMASEQLRIFVLDAAGGVVMAAVAPDEWRDATALLKRARASRVRRVGRQLSKETL